ncbi:MAG: class B sortase [Anaerostipes caccae]
MKFLLKSILAFCVFILIGCLFIFFDRTVSNKKAATEYGTIRDQVKKGEEIDFQKLRNINPDVVGWVSMPGTGIDYPIVQGKNNQEYLHKTFRGNRNASGAIFLDSKGKSDFTSGNNVIYGHHMRNGSMFAKILNYRKQSFLAKYHEIFLYSPKRRIRLIVVAAYAKSGHDAVIPIEFKDQLQREEYIKEIKRRSEVRGNFCESQETHRLYSFITCSYEKADNRTFVHAIEK